MNREQPPPRPAPVGVVALHRPQTFVCSVLGVVALSLIPPEQSALCPMGSFRSPVRLASAATSSGFRVLVGVAPSSVTIRVGIRLAFNLPGALGYTFGDTVHF